MAQETCSECHERPPQKYGKRCDACQRAAVLTIVCWDEGEAERQSRRGMAETRARGRNRTIGRGLR